MPAAFADNRADDNARRMMNRFTGLANAVPTLAALTAQAAGPRIGLYHGPCDASAAAALDAEHFVAGADEGDTLCIYRRGEAAAVAAIDLSGFLGTKTWEESDIAQARRQGSAHRSNSTWAGAESAASSSWVAAT